MWPFNRKKKNPELPEYDPYIRSKKDGTVTLVQTGVVVVDDVEYGGLRCTLVQPGQTVKKNQPIGKKP